MKLIKRIENPEFSYTMTLHDRRKSHEYYREYSTFARRDIVMVQVWYKANLVNTTHVANLFFDVDGKMQFDDTDDVELTQSETLGIIGHANSLFAQVDQTYIKEHIEFFKQFPK